MNDVNWLWLNRKSWFDGTLMDLDIIKIILTIHFGFFGWKFQHSAFGLYHSNHWKPFKLIDKPWMSFTSQTKRIKDSTKLRTRFIHIINKKEWVDSRQRYRIQNPQPELFGFEKMKFKDRQKMRYRFQNGLGHLDINAKPYEPNYKIVQLN